MFIIEGVQYYSSNSYYIITVYFSYLYRLDSLDCDISVGNYMVSVHGHHFVMG